MHWPWGKQPMAVQEREVLALPAPVMAEGEVFERVYDDLTCYITSGTRQICELSESEAVSLKE